MVSFSFSFFICMNVDSYFISAWILVLYIMLSIETHPPPPPPHVLPTPLYSLIRVSLSLVFFSLYVWLYPPNRSGLPSSSLLLLLPFWWSSGIDRVWRPAGVWIISTGIPGDERGVQGSWQVESSTPNHLYSTRSIPPNQPTHFLSLSLSLLSLSTLLLSRIHFALNVAVNLLFFPLLIRWLCCAPAAAALPFSFSHSTRASLWRRFSSKTSEWVSLLISRKPFDPFPDGNLSSLPCLMWCYALPRWLNGTSIQSCRRHRHRRSFTTTKIFKKTRRPFSLMDFDFLSFYFWKWNRKDTNNLQNVGTAASKLLYTLHWTLLDAAEECADADREAGVAPREPFPYIFPLTCIQVLYLFLSFVFVFSFLSLCLFVFTFLMATKWQRTFISPCPKFVIEFLLSLLF